jgi:hypothetical protein
MPFPVQADQDHSCLRHCSAQLDQRNNGPIRKMPRAALYSHRCSTPDRVTAALVAYGDRPIDEEEGGRDLLDRLADTLGTKTAEFFVPILKTPPMLGLPRGRRKRRR